MTRNVRALAFSVLAFGATVFVSGQDRSTWRTAADILEGVRGDVVGTVAAVDEARAQIAVDPDDGHGQQVIVSGDSVSTQYNGFGGVINGQAEIFTGSQGLANVRVGDRIDVRGVGRANNSVRAEFVTLLGRPTPSPQTGVGNTRTPTSISTPTASTTARTDRVSPVDGTVQQINVNDGRIVIVTDRREVLTARVSSTTPVLYRGDSYRVTNLEVGDRIRITPDATGGTNSGSELRASSIEVTKSVQEGTAVSKTNSAGGRVSSVDRSLDIVTVDNGRQSIRVDVATAVDLQGRRIRASDFRSGDRIEATGRYSATGTDLFVASVVRWVDESAPPARSTDQSGPAGTTQDVLAPPVGSQELASVVIHGTVRETLVESAQLVVRDTSGRTIRINALDDFIVRRGTAYVTADKLKAGDNVVVKAYRDLDGNYIAQTIRVR